jgi:DNA-binding transcriptional LysR family regulator
MQLERLRLFAALVKQGNYTRTAESLGISKAHLSKQIKALEAELENQLLIRNTRTMRLTTAGETLFQHAKKLTPFWDDARKLLETTDDRHIGTVRFTAPTGLMKYILLDKLFAMQTQYPDINIVCESGNETYNLITTPYDFAVRITNAPPEDMIAKRLTRFEYVCCASPQYLAKFGTPSHPNDLAQHCCIALSYWQQWLFYPDGKNVEINVDAKYQFSDNEVLKQAAIYSQGITRLPSYMIQEELKNGQLIALFQDIQAIKKDIYLLYPQVTKRPERVRIVIDTITNIFSDH